MALLVGAIVVPVVFIVLSGGRTDLLLLDAGLAASSTNLDDLAMGTGTTVPSGRLAFSAADGGQVTFFHR